MKKLCFLSVCALVLSLGAASAQNSLGGNGTFDLSYGNQYSNSKTGNLYAGLGLGIDSDGCFALDVKAGYLYPLSDKVSLGVGVGLFTEEFDYTGIKYFSTLQYTRPINNSLSFIAGINLGYLAGISNSGTNFIYEPCIGLGFGRCSVSLYLTEYFWLDDYGYDTEYYLAGLLCFTYNF